MLYLALAAVIVLADQLFKLWIVNAIPLYGEIKLIPGIIQLTHVHNEAAAFSLFKGLQLPIIILTCVVCLAGIAALILKKPAAKRERVAIALVIGGAIGNLIDRIAHGYVEDMFQTLFVDFPVFNIADCAIVIGGILFCAFVIFGGKDGGKKLPPPNAQETEELMRKLDEFEPAGEESVDEPADKSGE